jgi:cephalosporin hydroxylase
MSFINKIKQSISSMGKVYPVKNRNCTEFEIDNWELSKFVLDKLVPVVGVHPYPLNEQLLMAGAVCWSKPDYVFEWGTHHGKSARVFYETSKYFNINCGIHSVDLPDAISHEEHPGNERGKLVNHIPEVQLHQGDGVKISQEYLSKYDNNTRVLFFCDGDHSFKSVIKELEEIEKIPVKKYILLHDTFFQSSKSNYNIGPYKALLKFSSQDRYKKVHTNLGLPGMTFLYPAKQS